MRWNDLIGLQVGQYKVVEELGRGGAARVFRAYDEANLRPVAFKVLPIETDDRLAFMQRFVREAEVIRTLDHPNIVQVYDAGETEEFVFLVLRLLDGGTLRQRIASQQMSTQEACQYMIQIARALHHAHQQGIIHRDVKPSNMLLDKERPGHVLLTDFGTAKILNARGLTKTGATVGTPEYMSPEQAEGREVDQRSDIYSLGCALYEALAGRPPFVGATSVSVLYQQVHAQPTYIRSYNAEAPRELWNVLRTCLAKRPEDRYGTAERLAEELQPFAEGLIQPTPAPWHAPVTGRLNLDGTGALSPRPLRASPSAPHQVTPPPAMPPPFTPAPAPVIPGMSAQAPGAAGPIPLYLEGNRAPNSRPTMRPRGPRPTLRLPTNSGGSGLLSGPLTPEARHAVEAFGAQLEAEEPRAPTPHSPAPGSPQVDDYATVPTAAPGQRAPTSRPYGGATSGPIGAGRYGATSGPSNLVGQRAPTSGPYRAPTSGPIGAGYRAPTSGPYRGPTSGPTNVAGQRAPNSAGQRAPNSGPYRGATSGPIGGGYRGATSGPLGAAGQRAPTSAGRRAPTSIPANRGGVRRPAKRRSNASLVSIAAAVLIVGVALSMGGMKLFARQGVAPHPTPHPTAMATATALSTATPTIAQPTTTATQTAQQQLDRQAASAFRAITLSPFADGSCASSSMTTSFSGGVPVFVNLCRASTAAAGPVTVQVRQNGAVVRTLISNAYMSAGASYTQGHTLTPGSYNMLVTMTINGVVATAKDIPFTVK